MVSCPDTIQGLSVLLINSLTSIASDVYQVALPSPWYDSSSMHQVVPLFQGDIRLHSDSVKVIQVLDNRNANNHTLDSSQHAPDTPSAASSDFLSPSAQSRSCTLDIAAFSCSFPGSSGAAL